MKPGITGRDNGMLRPAPPRHVRGNVDCAVGYAVARQVRSRAQKKRPAALTGKRHQAIRVVFSGVDVAASGGAARAPQQARQRPGLPAWC